MIHLVSVFSNVLGVLTSVNVFLHVCFLRYFNRKKPIRILIALALAGLNFWGTRNVFSTPGMALLNFSAALIGMDLIGLVIRIFGKTRVYAFYRKLIKCGFAFLVAVVYAAYGLINFHIVRKTEYTFASEKVPEALTVGVVSDSHMGNGMDDEKLLSVIRKAVDDGADILVLAGDIVDESTEREMFFRFAEGMKSIRAPKGIYFVFGNHDASRWGPVFFIKYVEHLGAQTLWALETNEGAIRFYLRHGFRVTGERRMEDGTNEYLVQMEK